MIYMSEIVNEEFDNIRQNMSLLVNKKIYIYWTSLSTKLYNSFKYIGSIITYDGKVTEKINSRIRMIKTARGAQPGRIWNKILMKKEKSKLLYYMAEKLGP